jgi:antitoxin VapB
MSLNIKNAEAYALASELARLTGNSMTTVVLEALQKETRVQELMAIGQRCAAHIVQPVNAVDHGDLLYDAHGLPR